MVFTEELTIKYVRYDMIYVKTENGTYLDRYIPHEGYDLFVIGATYAKQLPPSKYYVIARTLKEARTIFKKKHGDILSVIKVVERCDTDLKERILNHCQECKRIVI